MFHVFWGLPTSFLKRAYLLLKCFTYCKACQRTSLNLTRANLLLKCFTFFVRPANVVRWGSKTCVIVTSCQTWLTMICVLHSKDVVVIIIANYAAPFCLWHSKRQLCTPTFGYAKFHDLDGLFMKIIPSNFTETYMIIFSIRYHLICCIWVKTVWCSPA